MTDHEKQIRKRLRTESALRGTLTQCRARIRELVSEKYAMAIATEHEIAELKKIHVGIIDKANHLSAIAEIRQFERDEQAKINAGLKFRLDNVSLELESAKKYIEELRAQHNDDERTIVELKHIVASSTKNLQVLGDKINALESRSMWDFFSSAFTPRKENQ
jgi:hypothetical protein